MTVGPDALISKENVSLGLLKEMFESAFFDVELRDDDLLVKSRYKSFVEVDGDKRFIRFVIFIRTNGPGVRDAALRYTEEVNRGLIVLRSYLTEDGNAIAYDQYIMVDGGVSPKNVIKTFKFYEALVQGAISRDTNGVLA